MMGTTARAAYFKAEIEMPTENTMKPFWNRTSTKILSGIALIFIFVLTWAGIPEYQKARADALVRDLCAKDGGMHVYEVVNLPASRFNSNGLVTFRGRGVLPPLERYKKSEDDFFYTDETSWILPERTFQPSVWKSHAKVFRNVDRKLLGEAISYSRRGGDPVGPWHPSSFGCPMHADITVLVTQTFGKQ